jgi:hypothetical protein
MSLVFNYSRKQYICIDMPATTYVLINCEYGFQEEIIKQLKELPELVEVYMQYVALMI